MKIIHTSDWHLGQYFMGKSRRYEHHVFLNWLIERVIEESADAVIVAGDIFDTGAPPSYARELYHQFIIDFSHATNNDVPLIIVAGNHDSVAMLDETAALLERFNAHVCSSARSEPSDKQVLEVKSANGLVKGYICCVPFLRARDMISSSSGMTGKEKQKDLQQAIQGHYADLFELAVCKREAIDKSLPIVMTGHLTVVGAQTSDSVRDIYIGSLEAFSAGLFPPADYIALGHIHKLQKLKSERPVYYCGSPIPLSFDELAQSKSVLVIEFMGADVNVKPVDVPRSQPMYRIKGNLNQVSIELARLIERYPGEPGNSESSQVWIEVEVQEQDYLEDLQRRIEALVEGSLLEVLRLKRSRKRSDASLVSQNSERLQELTPLQVFEKRIELENDDLDSHMRERLRLKFNIALNHLQEPK